MVILAYGLEDPKTNPTDERPGHFFAREAQTILRWVVRALILITAVTMFTLWQWAIIPATFLIIAYGLFMLANAAEKRSAAAPPAEATAEATAEASREESAPAATIETAAPAAVDPAPPAELEGPVLQHTLKVAGLVIFGLLLLAVVLTALFFGVKMILLAAPVIFAYVLLLGWPVWFAALEDDLEEQAGKAQS